MEEPRASLLVFYSHCHHVSVKAGYVPLKAENR